MMQSNLKASKHNNAAWRMATIFFYSSPIFFGGFVVFVDLRKREQDVKWAVTEL